MSQEVIITCAPAPSEKQPEKYPGRLDQAKELIACASAGAAIGHMHARDENLLQTVDASFFRSQVERIHASCELIVEGSTGGAPEHTLEERSVTFAVPGVELGSLNLGSINMYDGVFHNPYSEIIYYTTRLREHGVTPIMPIFDLSHIANFRRLEEAGEVAPPYVFELVFDVPSALPYSDEHLELMVSKLPPESSWFCVRYHQKGASDLRRVIELGGHPRVGYEDSPFLSDGSRAKSNVELVEDAVAVCREFGRTPVGAARAREILGLPMRRSVGK